MTMSDILAIEPGRNFIWSLSCVKTLSIAINHYIIDVSMQDK